MYPGRTLLRVRLHILSLTERAKYYLSSNGTASAFMHALVLGGYDGVQAVSDSESGVIMSTIHLYHDTYSKSYLVSVPWLTPLS
jgi:hypothetical protein